MPCCRIPRKQSQDIMEVCKRTFVDDNSRGCQEWGMVSVLCESPADNNKRCEGFGKRTRWQMPFQPICKRARETSLSLLRGTRMGNNLEQATARHVVSFLRKQESRRTASSHN